MAKCLSLLQRNLETLTVSITISAGPVGNPRSCNGDQQEKEEQQTHYVQLIGLVLMTNRVQKMYYPDYWIAFEAIRLIRNGPFSRKISTIFGPSAIGRAIRL